MINNKKSVPKRILEKILTVFYKRVNYFKKINFVRDDEAKKQLGLGELNAFQALKQLKRQVENLITDTGIDEIRRVSLFQLDYYELKQAINLIRFGVAKKEDFSQDPRSSAILNDDHRLGMFILPMRGTLEEQVANDVNLKEIARNNSSNEKQYSSLLYNFQHYRYDLMRNKHFTKRISNLIEKYRIEKYFGTNLYDISDSGLLYEAEDAIEIMIELKKEYFVTHLNNQPIEGLSKFTLNKLLIQVKDDNFEGCTVNKPAIEPVKEQIAIVDPDKELKDKKKLQTMIKRIVQAELKKAQAAMSVKKPTAKPIKKTAAKPAKNNSKQSKP